MDALTAKIAIGIISIVCMLVFIVHKRESHQESEENLKNKDPIRTLTQTEADILNQSFKIKATVGMPVYSLSGLCYSHKSHFSFNPFYRYYTIDNVRVTFLGKMFNFAGEYNEAELVFVDQKAIVVCLDGVTLSMIKKDIDNDNRWLNGDYGRYNSINYLALSEQISSLKQGDNTEDSEEILNTLQQQYTEKYAYSVSASREATEREIKQCQPYFLINTLIAMLFFSASGLFTIGLAYSTTLFWSCFFGLFIVVFMVSSLIFSAKEKRKLNSQRVNLVKGRITNVNHSKYQLTLNYCRDLNYPMYWDEFIEVNEDKDITLEVMVDSNYIVNYDNQLVINDEQRFGRYYPWLNKTIKLGFAFIMLIALLSASSSRYGINGILASSSESDVSSYVNVSLSSSYEFLREAERNGDPISITNIPGLCVDVNKTMCSDVLLVSEVQLANYIESFEAQNKDLITLYRKAINSQIIKYKTDSNDVRKDVANKQEAYDELRPVVSSVSDYIYSDELNSLLRAIQSGYSISPKEANRIVQTAIGSVVVNKLLGSISSLPQAMRIEIKDEQFAKSVPVLSLNKKEVNRERFMRDFYHYLQTTKRMTNPLSFEAASIESVKNESYKGNVNKVKLVSAEPEQITRYMIKQEVTHYTLYIVSLLLIIFQLFVCYQIVSMAYIGYRNTCVAIRVKNYFKSSLGSNLV